MGKRRCKQTTKAGKRCRSAPLSGSDFCISHSDRAVQAERGFGGSVNGAKGGAATRVPKLTEILKAKVEERADEIIDKLFEGLDAKRAVVVGTGPKARLEIVDDQGQVLATIREIFDRTQGRPKQVSESRVDVRHSDQIDREIERLSEKLARRANGDGRSSRRAARA